MTTEVKDTRVQPGTIYEVLPDGRWAIYLDATMCGTFGVCPQMFKYSFVDSISPKGDRPFVRDLGSWWSEVMESIYKAVAVGMKLTSEQILQQATFVWNSNNMNELETIHPKTFKSFGGMYGALRLVAEYATRQLPIDYSTWKIVAAEASFGRNREVCVGENDRVILYWMGQPDLFVIMDGRLVPVDHKMVQTITKDLHTKYKPHIQMPGYIIAAQALCKSLDISVLPIDRIIINAVARSAPSETNGKETPRFKRLAIQFTQNELEEWKLRRLEQATRLRQCFETNTWPWNEYACANSWGRLCQFHNIDSKDAGIRPLVIQSDYTKKEPWIPGNKEKEKTDAGV